jgi:hypothetical protein
MAGHYQIRIAPGGNWHRRISGTGTTTACGLPLSGAVSSRDWQLDEHLCSECFSSFERQTGEFKKLERQRDAEVATGFDDSDQTTDPDADGIIAQIEKQKP